MRKHISSLFLFSLLTFVSTASYAQTSIVIPSGSGNLEGNFMGGTFLEPRLRIQTVYSASHFPEGQWIISGMKFRRNRGTNPFFEIPAELKIKLSTTSKEPDGLSSVYNENVGEGETTVAEGNFRLSSPSPNTSSGPLPFDIIFEFEHPFIYDSSEGNLLIDIINYTGSNTPFIDTSRASDNGASRVFGYYDVTEANVVDSGGDVIEISLISPGNLLSEFNPSFENGLTGWRATGSVEALGPPRTTMNVGTDGVRAAALGTFDRPNSSLELSQALPVQSGLNYEISFDMLASALGTAGLTARAQLQIIDATRNHTLSQQIFSTISPDSVHNGAEGFSRRSLIFSIPNGVSEIGLVFLDVSPNGGRSVDLIIDNIELRPTLSNPNLVIPEGFANIEGDSLNPSLGQPRRIQEIYSSSFFPSQYITITGLSFRRDGSAPTFTHELANVEIRMSTTEKAPEGLSLSFDENTGEDETIVYENSLALVSFDDPQEGPLAFELNVPLNRPFYYDPKKGNLLIDINGDFEVVFPSIVIDATEDTNGHASRVFANSPEAILAEFSDSRVDIIQIEYEPLRLNAFSQIAFNPQTGLFEQTVEVEGIPKLHDGALRIYVSELQEGVELSNSSGVMNDTPYVNFKLAENQESKVSFVLEYYSSNRVPVNAAGFILEIAGDNETDFIEGNRSEVVRIFTTADRRIGVEFSSKIGRVYAIEYSDDMETWLVASPTITASGTRVQWIDDGPPKTISRPADSGSRFYRIIELAE